MNYILLFRGAGGTLFARINGIDINVPFNEDTFILPYGKGQINIDNRTGEQIYYVYQDNNETVFKLTLQSQQVFVKSGGGGGGIKGINVQEEGIPIGQKTTFNFTGAGVTATNVGGGQVNVDIPAGGGGTACADNGLHIDATSGCVYLGGSLVEDTIIDFDGFDLTFDFNGGNFNLQNVPVSVAPTSFLTLDAGGNIQVNPTGAGNGMFWALDGNTNGIERYIGTNDTFDFPIYTDGTEKMRVLTTGEVGINTTLPLANLHVVSTGLTQIGFLVDVPKAPVPSPAALPTEVNNAFRVNEYGMVMIGVVNVNDSMLEIRGYYAATETTQYLVAVKDNNLNGVFHLRGDGAATFNWHNVTGNLGILAKTQNVNINAINYSETVLYDNNANLNIFTTDTQGAGVGGTIAIGGRYGSASNQFYGFGMIRGAKENGIDLDGDGYLQFSVVKQGVGTIDAMRISSNGNIGIGTSSFGTNAATVLAIASGTAPTTFPAGMIQIFSIDDLAGNATLGLGTEETVTVGAAAQTAYLPVLLNLGGVLTEYKLLLG